MRFPDFLKTNWKTIRFLRCFWFVENFYVVSGFSGKRGTKHNVSENLKSVPKVAKNSNQIRGVSKCFPIVCNLWYSERCRNDFSKSTSGASKIILKQAVASWRVQAVEVLAHSADTCVSPLPAQGIKCNSQCIWRFMFLSRHEWTDKSVSIGHIFLLLGCCGLSVNANILSSRFLQRPRRSTNPTSGWHLLIDV